MLFVPELARKKEEQGVKGGQEGLYLRFFDSGCYLFALFENPTESDVDNILEGALYCKILQQDNVLICLLKCGNLPWVCADYTPHLAKHCETFSCLQKSETLTLTLVVYDTCTGLNKALKTIHLTKDFTVRLRNYINELLQMSFDNQQYQQTVFEINTKADADQLQAMAMYSI